MDSVDEAKAMKDAPTEGKITDEAIANAKAMIGMRLRPEGPYLQDVTLDTIRNFCNGIGDLNPIYRDAEYGRNGRYANVIAHPMFPMAYGWLGRTRWGLPGVHGFYAGNDWECFRNLRPGDRVSGEERSYAAHGRRRARGRSRSQSVGRTPVRREEVPGHERPEHDRVDRRDLEPRHGMHAGQPRLRQLLRPDVR